MNIDNYNKIFNKYPPLVRTDRWNYGIWVIGNDYRNKSKYYGSYPPSYLKRVKALFPDVKNMLHLFAGKVELGHWENETTFDINPELNPTVVGNSSYLPFKNESFELVLADPPYTQSDADKYSCQMPNRKNTLHECYRVLKPGGYCVWLDTTYPMYKKTEFSLIGTIGLIRSTNHRTRMVFVWRKSG
jgi:hypothetical protein